MLCGIDLDEQVPPDHKLQDQQTDNCTHNRNVNAQCE